MFETPHNQHTGWRGESRLSSVDLPQWGEARSRGRNQKGRPPAGCYISPILGNGQLSFFPSPLAYEVGWGYVSIPSLSPFVCVCVWGVLVGYLGHWVGGGSGWVR